MKTPPLTNLFIGLTVVLAAACVYLWLRENATQRSVQGLRHEQVELERAIQQHTNRIHLTDLRMAELLTEISQLENTVHTAESTIVDLRAELSLLTTTNRWFTAQLEVYTNAFTQATNQLSEAYDNIKQQNEIIQQVARERDEFAVKLNQSVDERNRIVTQYNELVDKMERIQPRPVPQPGPR